MKRKLLTQIKNEWRDNIWMILELAIVSVVLCLICAVFYSNVRDYFLPRGFEYDDVYTLTLNTLSKDSPYYSAPAEEDEDPYRDDLLGLVGRLRENPNVADVAVHSNAVPYNYNFNGQQIYRLDIRDTIGYTGNSRYGTPEIVEVMGFESLTGKTSAQLREALERGELLISDNEAYTEVGADPADLVGKQVIFNGDSSRTYRVADMIRKVRRNDYENTWGGTIIIPMDSPWGNVVIKVHPDHAMRFKDDFRNNPQLRRQRNVYLTNLTALSDTRESCQRQQDTQLHIMSCLIIFLMVTIFLGLLGTFWFRIQQRVGEIALRKVCGATRSEVFRRVISEGLLLLMLSALLMSAIIWPLSKVITDFLYCSRLNLLVYQLVALGLVAIGIVISLWYPARKAMRIEPAIALKSE